MKKKRQVGGAAADKKRRKSQKQEKRLEEDASFFLEDEDVDVGKEPEEEEEIAETAEEKRLRLAKAYLKQLRSSGADLGDDDRVDEEDVDDEVIAAKLKQQAQEAGGFLQRQIAERVTVPQEAEASTSGRDLESRFSRCHRVAVTALALTFDDATVYTVGKEGCIMKIDVESGKRSIILKPKKDTTGGLPSVGPEWVKQGLRQSHTGSLLAAAVSSDGQFLAVGGGDRKVHIWDTRSHSLIQSFPGHKDAITGLAFRHGTHDLYSASYDRSIKLWSLDDQAYVDTLFGHQAEVLAVDALRQERVVSSGHDHTCRVWKIAEESQLIYRGYATAIDCCKYVTGTEWITGGNDGTLSLWSQLKKKPAWNIRNAHSGDPVKAAAEAAEAGWIHSVAVCRGSDLVASGAADGFVRLWQVKRGQGPSRSLEPVGHFAANGFVNCMSIASSGRFVVAGLGQEPRLGRWGQVKGARSGVLMQPLLLAEEQDD